ncbi:MAG: hypothetical protein ACHREM_30390 [Polyangiales bacterium]
MNKARSAGLVVALSIAASACSNDPNVNSKSADAAPDVAADAPIDSAAFDSGASDSGAIDSANIDSGAIDSGAIDAGADVVVTPATPVAIVVMETEPATTTPVNQPGSTSIRAEFIASRVDGACTIHALGPACVLTTCGSGAVTRVSAGEIDVTPSAGPVVKLTPDASNVYAPLTLAYGLWAATGDSLTYAVHSTKGTSPDQYGGTSVTEPMSTIASPTVASWASGLDRSSDFVVALGASTPNALAIRFRSAGDTDGTGTSLRCSYQPSGGTTGGTVPTAALAAIPAGSYTLTIATETISKINPTSTLAWEASTYIDTIASDATGAFASGPIVLR